MSGAARDIWQALNEAGLLPAGQGFSVPNTVDGLAEDMIPVLIRLWDGAGGTDSSTDANREAQLVQRLRDWHDQGARLTLGLPGHAPRAADRWLGCRLVWWPCGVPSGRRVALVSSRLGRALDNQKTWFTVLRAACAKIDCREDLLLTSMSTTTAAYVERAASLFGLRVLRIEVPQDESKPLRQWFDRLEARLDRGADDQFFRVSLSPPIDTRHGPIDAAVGHIPLRDRAMVALSDRLMAFRVRQNGHVHQLIKARLSDAGWPAASVYLALGPDLVRTEMAGELMDQGAVGWVVLGAIGDAVEDSVRSPAVGAPRKAGIGSPSERTASGGVAGGERRPTVKIVPMPPSDHWPYLTHCTRRREGPWPEQNDADHIDDLILARPDADHSALSALRRILSQRRLIATAQAIRGGTRVVSFTAVPLGELRRLRVFRPHRGRWDFEPYGICIRREWLEGCGARHVHYGDDQLWETLSPEERPFFQLRKTRRPAESGRIDWSIEDEWRVIGDVELSRIPNDAALVFVPGRAEAEIVAKISRWPVTVIDR
jgi:hypothetical protein